MATDLKPIRTEADHAAAIVEVERLWGADDGTPEGDRLDVLATLIDAYEARARVAEVLNRKRNLSIAMIRRLHDKLGISAEVLIRPTAHDDAA